MPLLNFPTNPNPGERYTIGNITWIWTGSAWVKYDNPNKTFNQVTVTTSTNSTSTNTGALIVQGGLGVAQDLFVGGNIIGPGATALSNTATNIKGGNTGSIVFQLAPNITSFIGIGTTGSFLVSNGTTSTFSNTGTKLVLTDPTNATSLTSGAIVVAGGAAFGRDVWIGGNIYAQGIPVLTTATFGAVLNAGQDIQISAITGTNYLRISNISTLQSVTTRGSTTSNRITITNPTDSTSTYTGALVVAGGIGVGGQVSAERVRITDTIFDSTKTVIASSNGTARAVIDQYYLSEFRAAKYLVQIDEGTGTNAAFESREIMLLADNTGHSFLTEYALLSTITGGGGYTSLGEFSTDVTNVNNVLIVSLYFTPAIATNKTVNVLRIAMVP
jgi:hypothetical protein